MSREGERRGEEERGEDIVTWHAYALGLFEPADCIYCSFDRDVLYVMLHVPTDPLCRFSRRLLSLIPSKLVCVNLCCILFRFQLITCVKGNSSPSVMGF